MNKRQSKRFWIINYTGLIIVSLLIVLHAFVDRDDLLFIMVFVLVVLVTVDTKLVIILSDKLKEGKNNE